MLLAAGTGLMLMLQPVPAAPPAPPAATSAPATAPAGRSSDTVLAVAAAALPPLSGDAFRFTDIGPDARDATIFEAHRTPAGITRTTIGLSHTQAGWDVVSRDTRRLAAETFDYLSARIDAAITAPPAPTAPCADGTDYLGEIAKGGVVRSRGGCGENHPNVALARLFGVREKP